MIHGEVAARMACPRDHRGLERSGTALVCDRGHGYPVLDGLPIFVLEEDEPTHAACVDALRRSVDAGGSPAPEAVGGIDPYVQRMVAATCGRMYKPLIGKLTHYPIPELRLPPASGASLLDLGCGWGRWSIAAARTGYRSVGLDPSLDAIRAARSVTGQLGLDAGYVVGDARSLPFGDDTFDVVFSYSVLQHFSKQDVRAVLSEAKRILKPGGTVLVELPNVFGALNVAQQLQRRFREPTGFDVRYWRPSEMQATFEELIGPTTISVDSYLFINGQPADRGLLPARFQALIAVSEGLRSLSRRASFLVGIADSLYVQSVKAA